MPSTKLFIARAQVTAVAVVDGPAAGGKVQRRVHGDQGRPRPPAEFQYFLVFVEDARLGPTPL